MVLSASPFDAKTGKLLPVYRDAYLRGDLSRENTALVDAYLKKNAATGDQTWQRFHAMQQSGEQVQAVGWVKRQVDLIHAQPQRFRRRAGTLVSGLALITGAVFASTTKPATHSEMSVASITSVAADGDGEAAAASSAMMTVRGRILDEKGQPLAGATVLEKGSTHGVSTDAQGQYVMTVPANHTATLSYGYGGYTGSEIQVRNSHTENVTLVPSARTKHAKRWFLF